MLEIEIIKLENILLTLYIFLFDNVTEIVGVSMIFNTVVVFTLNTNEIWGHWLCNDYWSDNNVVKGGVSNHHNLCKESL